MNFTQESYLFYIQEEVTETINLLDLITGISDDDKASIVFTTTFMNGSEEQSVSENDIIKIEGSTATLKSIGETTITATLDETSITTTLTVSVAPYVERLYNRQQWINGQSKINADRMNHIEAGIDAIDGQLANLMKNLDITGIQGGIDFNNYVLKSRKIANIPLTSDISAEALKNAVGIINAGGAIDISSLPNLLSDVKNGIKVLIFSDSNEWSVTESLTENEDLDFDEEYKEDYIESYPNKITLTPNSQNIFKNKDTNSLLENYELFQFDIKNNLGIEDYYINVNDSNLSSEITNITMFSPIREIYKYQETTETVTNENVSNFYVPGDFGDEIIYVTPEEYDEEATYYDRTGFNFQIVLWFKKKN